MEILAARVGFCVGITRAYRLMNKRALDGPPFYVGHQNSSGDLDTLRRIERRDADLLSRYPGLESVSVVHDVSELRHGDRLVLGFHGLANNEVKEQLKGNGVVLLDDLQCPFIAKLDRVVERLVREGFDVAIVGRKENHHCKKARDLAERHGRRCFVIEKSEDIESIKIEEGTRVALVGQVTGNTVIFEEVVERIRTSELPLKIVRTICSDSYLRQGIAMDFAKQADVVLVLDDGGGASESVFEVCSELSKRVHRIRRKEDIRIEWLEGAGRVAVIGGILVPEWSIEEVARHVNDLCP